jgi:hypothetical protein
MSEPNSGPANLGGLPATVLTGHPADIVLQPAEADQAQDAPSDLVGVLCECQRRFAEVRTSSDEELHALVEAAFFIGLRLRDDLAALHRASREGRKATLASRLRPFGTAKGSTSPRITC